MNKLNSIEAQSNLDAIPLSDQKKFRLNEINTIKAYFNSEIQERKTMSKKLSKCIAAFDYIDKTFICNIWSNKHYFFYKCYWNSCRISKCKFYSSIFFGNRSNKKIVKSNKKEKKKKHNKIVMLAKSKLNRIETLMSQALIDLDISHEEFKTIMNEKEKYEQMEESIGNTKSRDELSENGRDIRKNIGNA